MKNQLYCLKFISVCLVLNPAAAFSLELRVADFSTHGGETHAIGVKTVRAKITSSSHQPRPKECANENLFISQNLLAEAEASGDVFRLADLTRKKLALEAKMLALLPDCKVDTSVLVMLEVYLLPEDKSKPLVVRSDLLITWNAEHRLVITSGAVNYSAEDDINLIPTVYFGRRWEMQWKDFDPVDQTIK